MAEALEEAVEDLRECLALAREQLESGRISRRMWALIDKRLDRVIDLLPPR